MVGGGLDCGSEAIADFYILFLNPISTFFQCFPNFFEAHLAKELSDLSFLYFWKMSASLDLGWR